MTVDAGLLIGAVTTILGAIITLIYWVHKRTKDTEDCVEGRLETMQEALHNFEKEVIDRLARIETKIGNGGAKRGAGEGHSE